MSTPRKPADEADRERIREDHDTTFFVEAAAGTGKTTALVGRIVALIRGGGGELERIVAVTFTDKAAGELKLRLRSELERARAAHKTAAEETRRLELALAQLELARIGTIHGFCSDILRESPVEAGIDPLFEVAPEDEKEAMLDLAFERWFQAALADPPPGVRRVLRRRPSGYMAAGPREMLRSALGSLVEHRDFTAAWRRPEFERDAGIDEIMRELEPVAALYREALDPKDWLSVNLGEIRRFLDEIAAMEDVRGRDYDGLEAELRSLAKVKARCHWHYTGWRKKPFAEAVSRAEVIRRRDAVKTRLDDLLEKCDADLAPQLREELRPAVESYELLKRRAGRLDFIDLLLRTRNLIRDQAPTRAALQARFTHFFVDEFQDTDPLQAEILTLLAADDPGEADWQAVNPVPGKLFLVGDPKQSIYRFRRADVAIYEGVKQRLTARGAQVLNLSTSFRSRPALQAAVNAAFAPAMQVSPDASQAAYVPLQPWREDVKGQPALVALPVPEPYGDYGTIVHWRISESLADGIGAFVHWLCETSGWQVQEGDEQVPVRPRHVCILFRRFRSFRDDVTRPYVRALEARRVPHVLVGGRSFHDREEVLAMRNALAAIEWPDDELRLFATLRGPFFAFGDDALLAWRDRFSRLDPLRLPGPDSETDGAPALNSSGAPDPANAQDAPVDADSALTLDASECELRAALALLGDLHRARNRRPVSATLSALLSAVRAHAGVAIWPTGEQALANCLRMIDLARRFEHGGAASFRAFVERMEADAEKGESENAPVVEEGTEGVRIMTAHKAKGLEFPVVILADPTCKAYRETPGRHVVPEKNLWAEPLCGSMPLELLEASEEELRRDKAEGVRLAYVAATRARDLLVVPVGGDARISGWVDVLDPAVYPNSRNQRDSLPAPGCPDFGEDSVYRAPGNAKRPPGGSVRPGLHRPSAGEHEVVWWDPSALELEAGERVGLRQMRILEADEVGNAEESEKSYLRWRATLDAARASAAQPALQVMTVTAAAEAFAAGGSWPGEVDARDAQVSAETCAPPDAPRPDASIPETTIETAVEAAVDAAVDAAVARPGGVRFGTLVHAVLALVDLSADAGEIATLAAAQGRLLGAPADEIEAAARAAASALAHPLMLRAAACEAAGGLRRETPVMLRQADGTLVEGIVDLAFREQSPDGPVWTVVDFKTDRDLAPAREKYAVQVSLYAAAISAATGESVRGVLFQV